MSRPQKHGTYIKQHHAHQSISGMSDMQQRIPFSRRTSFYIFLSSASLFLSFSDVEGVLDGRAHGPRVNHDDLLRRGLPRASAACARARAEGPLPRAPELLPVEVIHADVDQGVEADEEV